MDSIVKEVTEIQLHPNNYKKDGGFTVSQTWYPVTDMLKQSS